MGKVESLLSAISSHMEAAASRSTRCPSLRDDLLQEARIAAWRVAGRYPDKSGAELEKLAVTAIRNRVTDLSRRRTVYRRHLEALSAPGSTPASDEPEVRDVISLLRIRLAVDVVETLDLILDGHAVRDVARLKGKSRQRIYRDLALIVGTGRRLLG